MSQTNELPIPPQFRSWQSVETANTEMLEATKKGLEELARAHLSKASKKSSGYLRTTPNDDELIEDFLIEDTSEDESISIDDSSTSSSTNKLISAISGARNKSGKKKQKKQKKIQTGLVENAVMVQKLKNEIGKLEDRARYHILDMSNLNLKVIELQQIENRYKIFEQILKNIQTNELQLVDKINQLNNILTESSLLVRKHKLLILFNTPVLVTESVATENNPINIEENLIKLNQPLFTILINNKRNDLANEYTKFTNKIKFNIQKTSDTEMMYTYMQFVSVCVAIIASIYGGVYIYL
jgi:hypothetical protein